MELALTFGSFGDIITICQIAIQLGGALGLGSEGVSSSAKDYQDLRKDLDKFVDVLMQIVATYEQHEASPILASLAQSTRTIAGDCGALIKEALDKLAPKYADSLQPGGSGNKFRDARKRLKWLWNEGGLLQRLQQKLSKNNEYLSLLAIAAVRYSVRAGNATVIARIEEVHHQLDLHVQAHQKILDHLSRHEDPCEDQSQRLIDMGQCLDRQEKSQLTLLDTAKDITAAILQVKDTLGNIARGVVYIQDTISNFICIRSLDPTKGLPITLEDAFGYVLQFPEEWIEEWANLYVFLEQRFRNVGRGYEMILERQFALEDHCSGQDLDQSMPIKSCLRRGMKINMSMVFFDFEMIQGSCPRCKTAADAPVNVNTQCRKENCKMWFRLQNLPVEAGQDMLDDDEVDLEEAISEIAPEDVSAVDASSNGFRARNQKRKARVRSVPVTPSDFQRVRLFSKPHSPVIITPADAQSKLPDVPFDLTCPLVDRYPDNEASAHGPGAKLPCEKTFGSISKLR